MKPESLIFWSIALTIVGLFALEVVWSVRLHNIEASVARIEKFLECSP